MSSSNGNEVEVKIRLQTAEGIQDRLREAGFAVSVRREFESNTLFDTEDHGLQAKGTMLRLRQAGEKCVITFKGKSKPGLYKSREELETTLGSLVPMQEILFRLGYEERFRYEKFRTEFQQRESGEGTVTVDETPIGNFLELEGPGEWIDKTAEQLGFSSNDYIVESYGKLYLEECARKGVEPSNMVFAS